MNKLHFHMVCGKVVFTDPENGDQPGFIELNCIVKTKNGNVTVPDIDWAQKMLISLMYQKTQNMKLVPHDALIVSISHLGKMTENEFAPPAPKVDAANDSPMGPLSAA